ncbi:hypothetical protein HNQ07_002863 [Deinococcus metalli]|uniref:PQQ-like beta-propeller repeat protein n=1 Tax=Deinococcus metalli TaxID=1141878 RepID=A0A7W8KHZ7_9DEIO|nr:hypothetical protein [Deinococcus metalli]MBB5377371.1 hypothetical protein [Deinococcus metalli]GHF49943.1 hypothetical protein GCM10017781_27990 [Deinococcus metalli]
MKRFSLLALPLLLAACTGTEETVPGPRLALLLDSGQTIRTLTPNDSLTPAPITGDTSASVPADSGPAVAVDTLPSGLQLALTLTPRVEARTNPLAAGTPYAAPTFTPVCLIQTAVSAARTRLLTLSACPNGPQQLALYSDAGTLIWTALLPTYLPPSPGTDTPPIRLAVSGDVGVVARPRVGGGSEIMRAAVQNAGDATAVVSTPIPTPAIRDLAPYGSDIVAATDSGLQKLRPTGEPDATTTLNAFGKTRYDRVWSAVTGSRALLIAWPSDRGLGVAQQLKVWDGTGANTATVDSFTDLRDVTVTLDGYLYALTATTLSSYDTVFGLSQGNWRSRSLLTGLKEAVALTWLLPAPTTTP